MRHAILLLALVLPCCSAPPETRPDDPREWTHEQLMEGASLVPPPPDGSAPIAFVQGSSYQMGYQHGALLRDEIEDFRASLDEDVVWGAVVHLATTRSPDGPDGDRTYTDYALEHSLPFIVEECEGIVAGSEGALTLEECTGLNAVEYIFEDLFPRYLPGTEDFFNCSEFVAIDAATVDGALIHGRNMDWWPIEGIVDSPLILVRRPADGLRNVSVAWPSEVATFTGLNEAGIAVGIDGNGCTEAHRHMDGVPQLQLLTQVLMQADDLEEAQQIVLDADVAGCEMFQISHGPTRDAVTIEMSGTTTAVRGWGGPGVMALTNHFELPEMLDHQTLADVTDLESSSVCRYTRLMERLTGASLPPHMGLAESAPDYAYGKIDVPMAIDILRDPVDMRPDSDRFCFPCTEHELGYSVGSNHNVHSAVMVPEDLTFWLASGWDDECENVLYSPYLGYDAAELFEGRYDPDRLPTYDPPYNGAFGNGFH